MSTTYHKDNLYHTGMGVMTGTSLDGVDLCVCRFEEDAFEILGFSCVPFPSRIKESLSRAHELSAIDYFKLEKDYSEFLADCISEYHQKTNSVSQFVGVHGQTIFHDPSEQLTNQMLNGGLIAAQTGLRTVCDFRRTDVALHGQGAPLVPIGDQLLFAEYDACLNLGGFANISLIQNDKRIAFDICPVNFVLNYLAAKLGYEYDDGGTIARSGRLNQSAMDELNQLSYYRAPLPKSLGREWVERNIFGILEKLPTDESLRTMCEHISDQIAAALPQSGKVLITGGGAYNGYLISLISSKTDECDLVIPSKELIEGKEALIFAFLAKLRLEEKINVLSSVTGATRDSCSGAVFLP